VWFVHLGPVEQCGYLIYVLSRCLFFVVNTSAADFLERLVSEETSWSVSRGTHDVTRWLRLSVFMSQVMRHFDCFERMNSLVTDEEEKSEGQLDNP